jgi:hypothetical protein
MKQGEQTRGVPLAAGRPQVCNLALLVLARQVITASDQWSRFVVLEIGGTLAISKWCPWPAPHSALKSLIARQNLKGQNRGCQQ